MSFIDMICPDQVSGEKAISDFSKLLFNVYGGTPKEKDQGLTDETIAKIFKKFSNTISKKLNYDNTKIVKLDNTNNNDHFIDDSQKSEFANVMLLMTSKDKLLNLGKAIYEKGLSFDGIGNWQFFENILNLKDSSQICTYEQFIYFLSLFNNYCQNTFDVSDPKQWFIVKSFYEKWINK